MSEVGTTRRKSALGELMAGSCPAIERAENQKRASQAIDEEQARRVAEAAQKEQAAHEERAANQERALSVSEEERQRRMSEVGMTRQKSKLGELMAISRPFSVGNLVRMRDDGHASWREGVVTSSKPLKVRFAGSSEGQGHRWDHVEAQEEAAKQGDDATEAPRVCDNVWRVLNASRSQHFSASQEVAAP